MTDNITTEDARYIKYIEEMTRRKFSYTTSVVDAVKNFLDTLNPSQREILCLRYGFAGNKPHTYKKIAEILKEESRGSYSPSVHKISSIWSDVHSIFWAAYHQYDKAIAVNCIMSHAIKEPIND